MTGSGAVLVVAKAPVPGLAKTRLAMTVGAGRAADLAAVALLDTLDAARGCGATVLVALTGDLARAARARELREALQTATVFAQRGDGLGERLAHAHAEAHARTGAPVVQVGMDTPQLTTGGLSDALTAAAAHDAVLGPASDGGWWGLAVADPRLAVVLAAVPMSTNQTGARTRAALEAAGASVHPLPVLRDVDDWADAVAVAEQAGAGRFRAAVAQISSAIPTPRGDEPAT